MKKSNQCKALFLKSATLQAKQIGTNICQIVTPIICLIFTLIIQLVANANMEFATTDYTIPIPLGDMPQGDAAKLVRYECPQWFLYDVPD